MLLWAVKELLSDLMVIVPISLLVTISFAYIVDCFNIQPIKDWLFDEE